MEKYQEKLTQHAPLAQQLREKGWTVKVSPLVLGTGGAIPTHLVTYLQRDLLLPNAEVAKVCHKLNEHSVRKCHDILIQRRRLEAAAPR